MTLLELCEPLFQYICKLNRLARAGVDRPASQVRAEILAELDQMRAKAAQTPGLLQQFQITEDRAGKKGIELILLFFVDYTIRESRMPWAREWENLAEQHIEFAGDDRFFDLLEETLADKSPEAAERLTVFYTCLGLGFEGGMSGQKQELQRYLTECAARIRSHMDASDADRICREAYDHTDRRELNLPPAEKILNRVLLFAGLLLIVYVTSAFAYNYAVDGLTSSLDRIRAAAQGDER